MINAKVASGLHLLFQPGNYKLDKAIEITRADTVVMGIGLATLIATNGNSLIRVGRVDGVRVSGVLLQAGPKESASLLTWGSSGYQGTSRNPGAL